MGSEPDVDQIERMVLAAVPPGGEATPAIAGRVGHSVADVEAAVSRLVAAGLLDRRAEDGTIALTPVGELASTSPAALTVQTTRRVDSAAAALGAAVLSVGSRWSAQRRRRVAGQRAADAALLASDADRDLAVQQLSTAFAQGRMPSAELGERTGKALAARTRGDLDTLLRDIGGLQRPVQNHPVRKAVFGVVAFLFSPFVLLGTLLLAFGSDVDDHVGGLVFLVLFVPALVALWRWAWPRH